MIKFVCVILLICYVGCDETINYGALIENVYNEYGTGGVMIASVQVIQSFDKLTTWHEASFGLSAKNIPSVIVDFDYFAERIEIYQSRTLRPLAVIIIESMRDLYSFANITLHLDMSYPVWLIIFIADGASEVCDFCRKPGSNLLHLRFHSETVISCCELRVMDEWWFKRGGKVHRKPRAELVGDRVIWLSETSLYTRRTWVEDPEFRVAVVKGSGYIWQTDENEYSGLLGEVLHQLSHSMNFKIISAVTKRACGTWDTQESVWTGVIGSLRRNEADIGVAELSMTTSRRDVVDFVVPIDIGDSRLYIRKPNGTGVAWNAYLRAFEPDVWLMIFGLMLTVPLILTIIKYNRNFHLFTMIIEHYSCIWGIYCQQGLSVFPEETPLRIVYLSVFLLSLILSAVYSGTLISFLALSPLYLPFNSMEEFAGQNDYKLIVLRESSDYDMFRFSNDTTFQRMMALMKPVESLPQSPEEGFKQICRDKVAFHTNEAIKRMIKKKDLCEIVSVKTGRIETLGIVMPKHSPYTGLVDYHIQRFKDIGMVRTLNRKYFQNEEPGVAVHPPVPLVGITSILSVFGGGVLGALIIVVIERIIHYFTVSAQNKHASPPNRIRHVRSYSTP